MKSLICSRCIYKCKLLVRYEVDRRGIACTCGLSANVRNSRTLGRALGKKPLLERRVDDVAREPKFGVFCVGYEQSRWRAEELVRDFFRRHLNSFALTYSEWKRIDGDSAADALGRSARMVYDTDKYKRRGEFGELFLHGILRDFYSAEPAVSKLYYADGPNETAKGFDSVHVAVNANGDLDLWLGEAKLYQGMADAIREIISSLRDHIGADFLRREFLAVTNKLDDQWPHSEKLAELLDENTSLDMIIDRIIMPVLLTYQSTVISEYDKVDNSYEAALIAEAETAWQKFSDQLPGDFPVVIYFIVLPLEDTAKIRDIAHQTLRIYQSL